MMKIGIFNKITLTVNLSNLGYVIFHFSSKIMGFGHEFMRDLIFKG